ncbi:MAG TPA: Ig-like domain-containing protein [Longimicrobium sp.]|nr:Ig-like domain-containing protein [Longimicrobium sp.]
MSATVRRLRRFALAALLVAPAACTDRNPAGLAGDAPKPAPPPSSALAVLTCTADVRAATLACVPQGAQQAPGASATILGGQGTNVRLASSGTSYDGTSLLRSNITVENLTPQALGTQDGVTPAPEGVRVFFHSGPTVTGGSGVVAVENADGEGAFTAAGQKYFQYAGMLEPGDTTPAREWRFTLPKTVTTFVFSVYVATPVPTEAGWVSLSPVAPSLTEGETVRLTPTVRTVTGHLAAGEPVVAWSTTNPAVVTVDSTGLVTGVGPGLATITATSGGRTGSVSVKVTPVWYPGPSPTIVGIELPRVVTANGVDSAWVRMAVKYHGETSFIAINVTLMALNGGQRLFCNSFTQESGTAKDGVFRCATPVPNRWRGGAWKVEQVAVYGGWDGRSLSTAELVAAGAPARLHVRSPDEDTTAPVLHAFSFSPSSITAGDMVSAGVKTTDTGLGTGGMSVTFRNSASHQGIGCASSTRIMKADTIGFICQVPIPAYLQGGQWVVETVRVSDANGNFTRLNTADLQAAGYPWELNVTGASPDTVRPVITAFAFSPDTVPPNGVLSVNVALSAEDAHSGIGVLVVRFTNAATGKTKECISSPPSLYPTAPPSYTLECALGFGAAEAGTWRVSSLRAQDMAGNTHLLLAADVQAAGYQTELTVTPP